MTTQYIDPQVVFASDAPTQDKPPAFNNYAKGMDETRLNDGRPTIKQLNFIQQRNDLKFLYMHEHGACLPFVDGFPYEENAIVFKDGLIQQKIGKTWKPVNKSTDADITTWSGRTQEEKNKENPSPFDFGAKGDGTTDDTLAFVELESDYIKQTIDLVGKTYKVDAIPSGNNYINGAFKVNEVVYAAANTLLGISNGDASALVKQWAQYPMDWGFANISSTSNANSLKNPVTRSFGTMNSNAVDKYAFETDFIPVNTSELISVSAYFAYTGSYEVDKQGIVIEYITEDGSQDKKLFPIAVVGTMWRPHKVYFRLPKRCLSYRVGVYRLASSSVSSNSIVFFSNLTYSIVRDMPKPASGLNAANMIGSAATRLLHFNRAGLSPATAFQDFAWLPYESTLFIASGHDLSEDGSGDDGLVLNQIDNGYINANDYGAVIQSTLYTNPSTQATGHAGLSIQYNQSGTRRFWTGGREAANGIGTAIRFNAYPSTSGSDLQSVGVFKLFDDNYNSVALFPTVSYDGQWLFAIGRNNQSSMIGRVWRLADLEDSGDYSNAFISEFNIPYKVIEGRPIQGVAFYGDSIYIVTGIYKNDGSANDGARFIQLNLQGEEIFYCPDFRKGWADYTNNGYVYEPEGLAIYQPDVSVAPCLAVGIKSGESATKTSSIWLMGRNAGSSRISAFNPITTSCSGNTGNIHWRNNSDNNIYHAVQTNVGRVYYGTNNGSNFSVGPEPTTTNAYLVAYSLATYAATDNAVSLGRPSNRYSTVYATTGTINTSDERLKQQFRKLTAREKDAAIEIKNSICMYKFNDAVEIKGDGARWHCGVKAQEVISIMKNHGLNPLDYAFVCFDEWGEQEEIRDEEGIVIQDHQEAVNRYGIRYEELSMFIFASI